MKLFIIVALLATTNSYAALSAKQIAKNTYDLADGKTMTAKVKMVIEKTGSSKERTLEILRLDNNGQDRYLMRICAPSRLKGTTFLSWNNPKKDSKMWLYLPSRKKARKISSNSKYKSFVASDFSYDDLTKWSLEKNNFKTIKEEKRHYVLQITSLEARTKYAYKKAWVRKDNFVVQKIEYYNKKHEIIKKLTVTVTQKIKGYWTIMESKMRNLKEGSTTTLTMSNVIYNKPLSVNLFKSSKLGQKCFL